LVFALNSESDNRASISNIGKEIKYTLHSVPEVIVCKVGESAIA
ncbi:hypothetical protein BAE44_0000873, partial [Dichanthelium oligosanthes]